ncbi:hypothetical protein B0T17DRAFT_600267 [Bombardia bombarda]|uniref:Uncharacterized protein n=1 Tax=Bombardia bombarda TaxID=252184 RepID=A0AA40C114_9PEZI|nr:hypothetical protein B0T17DRAFT_600267 [Bombardia bombarda]
MCTLLDRLTPECTMHVDAGARGLVENARAIRPTAKDMQAPPVGRRPSTSAHTIPEFHPSPHLVIAGLDPNSGVSYTAKAPVSDEEVIGRHRDLSARGSTPAKAARLYHSHLSMKRERGEKGVKASRRYDEAEPVQRRQLSTIPSGLTKSDGACEAWIRAAFSILQLTTPDVGYNPKKNSKQAPGGPEVGVCKTGPVSGLHGEGQLRSMEIAVFHPMSCVLCKNVRVGLIWTSVPTMQFWSSYISGRQ